MAYSQRETLVTGLKNAYALEAHAADVTQNQASRPATTRNFSAACSSTTKRRSASAIDSASV